MVKKPFTLTVEMGRTVYILNREAAAGLLRAVESFGEECGHPCKRLREDLRKALAAVPEDGREAEIEEITTLTVDLTVPQKEPDAGAPECFMCEARGERLPQNPGDTEPLWVCRSTGCPRRDKPAARMYFETGHR